MNADEAIRKLTRMRDSLRRFLDYNKTDTMELMLGRGAVENFSEVFDFAIEALEFGATPAPANSGKGITYGYGYGLASGGFVKDSMLKDGEVPAVLKPGSYATPPAAKKSGLSDEEAWFALFKAGIQSSATLVFTANMADTALELFRKRFPKE